MGISSIVGVGLALRKYARTALLRWNPVSDRITRARFNSRNAKLTVRQLNTPINDQLQREVERTPMHDMLIIMGEMNAKVGEDNVG